MLLATDSQRNAEISILQHGILIHLNDTNQLPCHLTVTINVRAWFNREYALQSINAHSPETTGHVAQFPLYWFIHQYTTHFPHFYDIDFKCKCYSYEWCGSRCSERCIVRVAAIATPQYPVMGLVGSFEPPILQAMFYTHRFYKCCIVVLRKWRRCWCLATTN